MQEAPPQLGEEALASFSETEVSSLVTVSDIQVKIVRKDIKNLHLAVYPPDGHVRVAAPQKKTDDNVRLAVVSRLAWIRIKRQLTCPVGDN